MRELWRMFILFFTSRNWWLKKNYWKMNNSNLKTGIDSCQSSKRLIRGRGKLRRRERRGRFFLMNKFLVKLTCRWKLGSISWVRSRGKWRTKKELWGRNWLRDKRNFWRGQNSIKSLNRSNKKLTNQKKKKRTSRRLLIDLRLKSKIV